MEEQHGNQDIGVISSHVSRVWYKNNRNEQENVNPEQSGINYANEMELAVMTKPETREN
jgi:hypothetical protein